jgi:Tol biopolymer transport system component
MNSRPTVLAMGALLAALVAAPGLAAAALATEQLTTDSTGSGCGSFSPVSDSSGSVLAYESNCNPSGANADGSMEIFRIVGNGAPQQVSGGEGCTSSRPSISSDGSRIAFESNCNLTGGNADLNTEIFLWRSSGQLSQLTVSMACENLAPSINAAGNFVAFDSNCIYDQNNIDGSFEIFRVTPAGIVRQLTRDDSGNCDSIGASIDSSGSLVAFESDCDLTGQNEDFAIEIFTVTANGAVSQRTQALDDTCSSVGASMDAAGALIAFQSDCNFTGANGDGGDEIFTVNAAGAVGQLTNSSQGPACTSGLPRMAASGKAVVFSSWCPLGGKNNDGSVEVFQVPAGANSGGLLAVTAGTGCSSVAGTPSANGDVVLFDSDCNPASANADRSVEVFRSRACVCGAPSTRESPPKASDALLVLRAAVGTAGCSACECDTDANGSTTAADALRILKRAVGQSVDLTCPA